MDLVFHHERLKVDWINMSETSLKVKDGFVKLVVIILTFFNMWLHLFFSYELLLISNDLIVILLSYFSRFPRLSQHVLLPWKKRNYIYEWLFFYNMQRRSFVNVLQDRFLANFAIFTGKHLCWSLFLKLYCKGIQHKCFAAKRAAEQPFYRIPLVTTSEYGLVKLFFFFSF